ncbi:MAG TPA: succinate dehydrogenase assembly factor 2 [Caulobacter sp.]|nr:succinate dehydrogenase assembly factor 2 [Caulobacter sp.]
MSKDALAHPSHPLYIRRLCMDEHRLKKIRLRAWRRGFREADLILGPFADRHCPTMTAAQLDAFEALLEEADQDIYDWYLGRSPVAAHINPEIFALLQAFDPSGRPAGG